METNAMNERRFVTIRQFCRAHGTPEHLVRDRVANGRCPGIKSGNRFLVNQPLFLDLLDSESKRTADK